MIDGDIASLEARPLETSARNGQLESFVHRGFWQLIDALRDKSQLEEL